MRSFIILASVLYQTYGQVYKELPSARERKSLLGPFPVANKAACELACNCARGDARDVIHCDQDCAQFSGVVKAMDCTIYYYTPSFCSFLGDYTINTCMLQIVEHHLVASAITTTTEAAIPIEIKPVGIYSLDGSAPITLYTGPSQKELGKLPERALNAKELSITVFVAQCSMIFELKNKTVFTRPYSAASKRSDVVVDGVIDASAICN